MKNHLLVALVVLGGSATLAQAQIEIAGSASGLFDGVSTTYGGLSYMGSTFDVFPAFDFYALGGNAGPPNINNLGSIMLNSSAFNYNSPPTTFTLNIDFSNPTGVVGGQMTTYMATLTGHVINSNTGGVLINFGTAPQTFTFSNATEHGTFTLEINPVSIFPGHITSITGFGTTNFTVIPAPGAVACMALGLVGTAVRRRKRR